MTMNDKETIERLEIALEVMTQEKDRLLFLYDKTFAGLQETIARDDLVIAELRKEVMELKSQILVKLSKAEHHKLKVIAAMRGITMSQMIRDWVNSLKYSDVCDVSKLED